MQRVFSLSDIKTGDGGGRGQSSEDNQEKKQAEKNNKKRANLRLINSGHEGVQRNDDKSV